ncbi:YbaB/EbfC family nucleoid-associated protein [Actinoplanes sp. NPDC051494]|uniref:YbaB/EbfC family nucleoid-associated protein n=1 Tax=Actinoplanes sp. NPDC051494 TaxID=3363907 RepID=UPI00379D09B3
MSDGGAFLDPDESMAYLRGWKTRIDRVAADTQAMSDRLGQLRVTAEDENGFAEVTIDSTGVLVDVRFSERIQRVAPDVVSRALLNAIEVARSKAAERTRQIISDSMGSESVAARAVADRMERQLRGPGVSDG